MKSALISPLLAGLLLLTGCAQPAAQAGGGGGGTIKACIQNLATDHPHSTKRWPALPPSCPPVHNPTI